MGCRKSFVAAQRPSHLAATNYFAARAQLSESYYTASLTRSPAAPLIVLLFYSTVLLSQGSQTQPEMLSHFQPSAHLHQTPTPPFIGVCKPLGVGDCCCYRLDVRSVEIRREIVAAVGE